MFWFLILFFNTTELFYMQAYSNKGHTSEYAQITLYWNIRRTLGWRRGRKLIFHAYATACDCISERTLKCNSTQDLNVGK